MRRDDSIQFILSGGLGNQLFLLAAGLSICEDKRTLHLNTHLGNPRLSRDSQPEVFRFTLPRNVLPLQRESSRLQEFIFLFLLKVASKKFQTKVLDILLVSAKTLLVRISRLFSAKRIFLADGVGFDHRSLMFAGGGVMIGNFHSYRYCTSPFFRLTMDNLTLIESPDWLLDLVRSVQVQRPVVVQIRRGDYLGISELGILDANYFMPLIDQVAEQFPLAEIWIFSDDYQGIYDYVSPNIHNRVRLIDYDSQDAAANLQAMRLGCAYIISNSTFGWWGAYLSTHADSVVYCPQYWFRSLPNPIDLIPSDWILVNNR